MSGNDQPIPAVPARDDPATPSWPGATSLVPLVTYLQEKAESEKAELTRELHDNLGGLMVAALMDAAWAQSHMADGKSVQLKLERLSHALTAAIDLKRRLIEAVRPTLLDNFGLFAALRWLFKHTCEAAGIPSVDELPEEEILLPTAVSIAVFRVVEEALPLLTARKAGRTLALTGGSTAKGLAIGLWQSDGCLDAVQLSGMPAFASLAHRIALLGGTHAIAYPAHGGSSLMFHIPL